MKKYEYYARVDNFHLDVLNAMGNDGWRYIEQKSGPAGVKQVVMFFEREIQEPDVEKTQEVAKNVAKELSRQIKEKKAKEVAVE